MNLPLPTPAIHAPFLKEVRTVHQGDYYTAEQMQAYRADLIALVAAVHKAKGRHHSQIAMCDLYDACGLPNTRPTK